MKTKDKAAILEKIYRWNPWWRGQPLILPGFHRQPFEAIQKGLSQKKIQVLAGPRQTGKTTLLKQLAQGLQKQIRPAYILYLPLDDFMDELTDGGWTLRALLDTYAEEVAKTPLASGEKYLFLDEVHVYPRWSQEVKTLHDQGAPLHILISGSASANILSQAALALAGRSAEHPILPLGLHEILSAELSESDLKLVEAHGRSLGEGLLSALGDHGKTLRKAVAQAERGLSGLASTLRSELAHYLRRGGFPEPVFKNLTDEESDLHLHSILEQMIRRDFVDFFHVRDTKTLERLIRIIAQNTGRILVERKMASDLSAAINTVRNHIGFLEKVYVVFTAKTTGASELARSRLPEKYFFLDPGLRNSLVGYRLEDRGQLLETAVYVHLWSFLKKRRPAAELCYWRKGDREVDIVLKQGKAHVPIEVHHQDDSVQGLNLFLDEQKSDLGILISEAVLDLKHPLLRVPPHLFLLIR